MDSTTTRPVTLGALLSVMGSRAHGLAVLILALPDTLPLPIPSTSTILGVPLVILAGHLMLFGEGSRLPDKVAKLVVPRPVIRAMAKYAAPVLQILERFSRHRLPFLLQNDRALGAVCLYLSVLLLLPIPFLNAAPAACLVAIALGMVQRDGVIAAAGILGTIVMSALTVFFADWITHFVRERMLN